MLLLSNRGRISISTENEISSKLKFDVCDTPNMNMLKDIEIPIMILLALCSVKTTNLFLS